MWPRMADIAFPSHFRHRDSVGCTLTCSRCRMFDSCREHYTRVAVMFISTVPWQAPPEISVRMVPDNVPSGWGV